MLRTCAVWVDVSIDTGWKIILYDAIDFERQMLACDMQMHDTILEAYNILSPLLDHFLSVKLAIDVCFHDAHG